MIKTIDTERIRLAIEILLAKRYLIPPAARLPEADIERLENILKQLEATTAVEPAQVILQDIEQYRVQMAAISCAALGYWKEGDSILPDYDTVPLHDVARLYAKYDALYQAKQEQAQAVPVEPVMYQYRDKPNCDGWEFGPWKECDEFMHLAIKSRPIYAGFARESRALYTAPPAIDDETKRMVLELCELTLINVGPCGMVTAAMKQRAEQIREKLEAVE